MSVLPPSNFETNVREADVVLFPLRGKVDLDTLDTKTLVAGSHAPS